MQFAHRHGLDAGTEPDGRVEGRNKCLDQRETLPARQDARRGALEKGLRTVGDGAWNGNGDAVELQIRMSLQDPAKKGDQTISKGRHRLAEFGRLMMLHEQGAAEIGNPDAECGLVERGNEDAATICSKPHEARCAAPGCGAEFAFVDEADFAERPEAVSDDRAAEFTLTLDFLACGGLFCPHQIENFDNARRRGLGDARPAFAAGSGVICRSCRRRHDFFLPADSPSSSLLRLSLPTGNIDLLY